jgi:hypothetical protein
VVVRNWFGNGGVMSRWPSDGPSRFRIVSASSALGQNSRFYNGRQLLDFAKAVAAIHRASVVHGNLRAVSQFRVFSIRGPTHHD